MSSVEVLDASRQSARVTRAELFEHRLLDAHVLEDRLDDEIDVGEVLVVERCPDAREPRVHLFARQLPFRQ